MSEPITVTHRHGERITVEAAGVELMTYVYEPDPVEFESRKPYAHPLRTPSGNTVTGYRPNDHRWHKGLQMTASHVSGQNFWGGNSYVRGAGYQALPERVGSMRHDDFERFDVATDRLSFVERLTWLENGGQPWAEEKRGLDLHSVDTEEGSWALDWSIRLTNLRPEPLRFGSPTTEGREMAGYTGLHWRGPRDFTGGEALGADGRRGAAELMGQQAPWLGFVGAHDGVDRHSTVVFAHAPENAGAIHESHWFVRAEPAPTVAASWAFFEEFELAPGDDFTYRYRVVVADGAWDHDRIERYLKIHSW
ncbi:hypothetical protein FHX42_003496 [Saccharopolyspora lacisalsi]|uniref:Oxidoreductase n=1 Tax=Halosaccharopolyspora lacisalsi TaxID=1000566 RepID=A0A839DZ39_9PSEU|nr:PmoA family protein [Halosaccharopolyspora lacisalsi]MBA8826120.1 hypothetical protein [Halosaccharopolyspora lacisalsi]